MERVDCLGVGSPIVDTLAFVSEDFVIKSGAARGSMTLVDDKCMAKVMAGLGGALAEAPGGSAGNTVVALARLGANAALLGKTGDDETGTYYCEALARAGGKIDHIKKGTGASARCLSMITPDAQRTMMTNLGAAATIRPDEISVEDFDARLVYLEGYLIYNRPFMDAVLENARKAGAKIGLDLGSYSIVESMREDLLGILKEYVHFVIANEDEARAMFGEIPAEEQAMKFGEICPMVLLNQGAKGSIVVNEGSLHHIPAFHVERVLDTTGAGDLCIAGFLYAWLNGASPSQCGECGAVLGSEVVQVMGAFLDEVTWKRIRKAVGDILRRA